MSYEKNQRSKARNLERRRIKREEALERQAARDSLTPAQQLLRLDQRGMAAKKERERLMSQL